jgi:TonB family protein
MASRAAKLDFASDASKALRWSLVVHALAVIVLVSCTLVVQSLGKPKPVPHIFELQGVKGPEHVGAPGRLAGDSRKERTDKAADLGLPSLDKRKPSDAKTAKSTDAKAAKSKSSKPKLMTYEEFMKEKSKTSSGKKQGGPSTAGKKQNVKIDASGMVNDMRKNLADLAWGDDGVGGGGIVGGTGVTSGEMDALALYFMRVRALIDANFVEPRGLLEQVSTMVQFTIQTNGVVTDVSVVGSSGNDDFDAAAASAVSALGTLDPPPGNQAYTRKIEFVGKQGE